MKLPNLQELQPKKKQIIEFKGYNHNPNIGEGEFYDMKNLSSSLYPVLSPRKPRGTVQQITKPNGLTNKNGLVWVDSTNFFYKGEIKGQVTDTKKQFVSMGAYILIFPDKKYYNTTTGEFGLLEVKVVISGSYKVQSCRLDGTLTNPAEGLYAKITSTGIGTGFKKYDGVEIFSGVDAINGNKTIQNISSNYIIVAALLDKNYDLTGIAINRDVPDMDFVTENENRVFGCSSAKHEIYASKLGDPFNWNCYEGISTDSYAVTIGSDGDFTGATTFLGYVIFFKEDRIHKVYGNKPSNYQVMDNSIRGVAKGSEKSITIVNETLYYMSRNGIMAYSGSFPDNISHAFGENIYSDGVAGSIGDKYYISAKEGETHHLFVFDEAKGMWHKEDNTKAIYFTRYDNKLYYIDGATNKLMTIEGDNTEIIEWYADFSDFSEKIMNKKYVNRLQLLLELENNSFFEAEIQYNGNGLWEKITTLTGKMKQSYNIPVQIRRCDYYTLRLSGIGDFKLYNMVKTYTEGSDL